MLSVQELLAEVAEIKSAIEAEKVEILAMVEGIKAEAASKEIPDSVLTDLRSTKEQIQSIAPSIETIVAELPAEEMSAEVVTEMPAQEIAAEAPVAEVAAELPAQEMVSEVAVEAPIAEVAAEVPAQEIAAELPAEAVSEMGTDLAQ